MVSKGFPNVITSGRQYNIGEKPSVILYTYINLHAETPKPHPFNLRVLDYSVVIWSYMILEKKETKKNSKIILVQVNIIFALPDYSSGVTERHQKLFYGRLINLTLEFDIH